MTYQARSVAERLNVARGKFAGIWSRVLDLMTSVSRQKLETMDNN